jgi:hypothetical protein
MSDDRLFGTHIREAWNALKPRTERGKRWLAFWFDWVFVLVVAALALWLLAAIGPHSKSLQ